jgi:hypothetical protein
MIHPPHLTLYTIVAATTCGASLVFLLFVSLYSIARVLVHLVRRGRLTSLTRTAPSAAWRQERIPSDACSRGDPTGQMPAPQPKVPVSA